MRILQEEHWVPCPEHPFTLRDLEQIDKLARDPQPNPQEVLYDIAFGAFLRAQKGKKAVIYASPVDIDRNMPDIYVPRTLNVRRVSELMLGPSTRLLWSRENTICVLRDVGQDRAWWILLMFSPQDPLLRLSGAYPTAWDYLNREN